MINFLTTTKYFRKDSQSRSSLRQPLFRSPFAGVEIEMVLNTINWKKKKKKKGTKRRLRYAGCCNRYADWCNVTALLIAKKLATHTHTRTTRTHARTHAQRDRTFNLFQLVARFVHYVLRLFSRIKPRRWLTFQLTKVNAEATAFQVFPFKPRCATNMRIERASFLLTSRYRMSSLLTTLDQH